jgi:TPR repeat protein
MVMADSGNSVARKLYADLIFYKKIFRKRPYAEAFSLYLKSAGLTVDDEGSFTSEGDSYPLSFWIIGYYLMDYRRSSLLQKCEEIPVIEKMSYVKRLSTALYMAASCILSLFAPGALNLTGRILDEAGSDENIFAALKDDINKALNSQPFPGLSFEVFTCNDRADCMALSEKFFRQAADTGYIYACNNLAAKEAERIVGLSSSNAPKEELNAGLERYISFLKLSADKYEPYAANRLGLFYINGEIKSGNKKAVFRDRTDTALAKHYFEKATVYPDPNSAWAYYNLIRYFHRDYDRNIALLNEHMELIKLLNPAVYDLAIEL